MRPEALLGCRVRYRGEVGRVVGVDAAVPAQAMLTLSISRTSGVPRREVVVPAPEWGELELLDPVLRCEQ